MTANIGLDWDKIAAEEDNRQTYAEIGRKYGVSRMTAKTCLERRGFKPTCPTCGNLLEENSENEDG